MLTILSALIGFLSSAFPEVVKFFQDKQDKKHELVIMDKQIEMQKLGLKERLEEIRVEAESSEMRSLYQYAQISSGSKWVDAFAATVRPALAYAFIFMFLLTKLPIIFMILNNFIDYDLTTALWTESDACIFSSIIAFYFGSRQFSKMHMGK